MSANVKVFALVCARCLTPVQLVDKIGELVPVYRCPECDKVVNALTFQEGEQ